MGNEISSFDLERLAKKYDIRIWFCKKTGKRWSFLVGAGEQRPLPSELVYFNGDFGFFVQGEDFDDFRLKNDIKELVQKSGILEA
ncbi:MAG: hypothetical protein ACQETH_08985 [Candidatus Rifleibacteriota bacterium]